MKVLITIPTYNEAENLPSIVERVRHAAPEVDILVVDDHSPPPPMTTSPCFIVPAKKAWGAPTWPLSAGQSSADTATS